MHLVDALARVQLTASGQLASSVPIVYQGKKMTLLKGDAALAARRAVASKLDHRAITALRRPMHVDKPDWTLMQRSAATPSTRRSRPTPTCSATWGTACDAEPHRVMPNRPDRLR